MSKKILLLPVVAAIAIIAVVLMAKPGIDGDAAELQDLSGLENTVSITMSSSRPGCDANDNCFVPSTSTIRSGQSVTWINHDSGFHTVTSGYYDTPDGGFDSGQLDPDQKFSHTFDDKGSFHYYCRLHPWMQGQVNVN